jgi:hypothetical protein
MAKSLVLWGTFAAVMLISAIMVVFVQLHH